MKKEDCFELGVISKLFSFKGEVIMYLDSDQPDHYYDLDMAFLEINKQLVPFFIEKSSVHKKNQLRIRFEGVEEESDAKRIVKKKVYLPLESLPELAEDQFYYHEVKGFILLNQEEKEIGRILDVLENPSNTLLEVDYNGNEALIPLNDNVFIKVDKSSRTLTLQIPEGLLDIYS